MAAPGEVASPSRTLRGPAALLPRIGSRRAADLVAPVVSIGLALAAWEVISRTGTIAQTDLPAMSTSFDRLWELMQTGEFWKNFGYTVRGWALGLGIATALAVPLGILLGSSDFAARAFRVPIEFLRPIPSAVLIPLLFLTLGANVKSEIFLAAFGAFWPLLVQTMYGVRDVDPLAVETARSFGVGRVERLFRVKLPSSLPYIATGLRISSTVALILAFTAELFMGTPGLGQAMNFAQSFGLNDELYALALATGFLGLAIHFLMTWLERRALHWHASQRVATP
jgi:ABC-type nitrate/sulfonate/bicarbonate transport system permease component